MGHSYLRGVEAIMIDSYTEMQPEFSLTRIASIAFMVLLQVLLNFLQTYVSGVGSTLTAIFEGLKGLEGAP